MEASGQQMQQNIELPGNAIINWQLPVQQAAYILQLLGTRPYAEVEGLVGALRNQLQAQALQRQMPVVAPQAKQE